MIPHFISPGFAKALALGWVGLGLLVGLMVTGDNLYAWIGRKLREERDAIVARLDLMFIEVTPPRAMLFFVGYLILLFSLGLFMGGTNIGGGFCFGILFVFLGFKLPMRVLQSMFYRRVKRFVLQMVDGLSLMSNAMRSGLNVPQALQLVSDELPNPISQEFALVLSQNKLGITLEEALSNLSVRMPQDDIEMFTTSVNILKETGGNLAETFDTISVTIRERIKIESKIAAMTAQGVMQGVIVVMMPFALGGILYAIDPERVAPMFTTIPGWVLLLIMMSLQVAGGFAIWKIVQVRV